MNDYEHTGREEGGGRTDGTRRLERKRGEAGGMERERKGKWEEKERIKREKMGRKGWGEGRKGAGRGEEG